MRDVWEGITHSPGPGNRMCGIVPEAAHKMRKLHHRQMELGRQFGE